MHYIFMGALVNTDFSDLISTTVLFMRLLETNANAIISCYAQSFALIQLRYHDNA